MAAGDAGGGNGKASRRNIASKSGESELGVAPCAHAVFVAAVGAHIGVVGGALAQAFDGGGVGGHVNGSHLIGVEVGGGAVGNLPSVLSFFAVGPAQGGGVGGLRVASQVGRLNAGGSFGNDDIVQVNVSISIAIVGCALEDDDHIFGADIVVEDDFLFSPT